MPQSLLSVQPPQLNGMDRVFVEGATPTTLQCVKLKSIPAQRDITHCTRRMGANKLVPRWRVRLGIKFRFSEVAGRLLAVLRGPRSPKLSLRSCAGRLRPVELPRIRKGFVWRSVR